MSETTVFRTALDLAAAAVISSGKTRYVLLSDDEFLFDMMRSRIQGSVLEIDRSHIHDRRDVVALSLFSGVDGETLAKYDSHVIVAPNPLIRWPFRIRWGRMTAAKTIRILRKKKYHLETEGSGTPLYFLLTVLSYAMTKQIFLHFYAKDLANRLVASRGRLGALGAILVLKVRAP